jgi:DNA-binding MarR family transcriptional regulator
VSEFIDVFTRTSKLMRAVIETSLRRHGLHLGQNLVLDALGEQDGQTPGGIAAALHVTTPTVVKMATRMTTAGLIVRRRDDVDNRLVRLYLTDAGQALRQPVAEELHRLELQVTAGLSAAERRVLINALDKVTKNALNLAPGAVDAH